MASSRPVYRIGIETEVLISFRSGSSQVLTLEHAANKIRDSYNPSTITNGLPRMHVDIDGEYEGNKGTVEWSIVDDASLAPDSNRKDQYPMEFVSPVITIGSGDDSIDNVEQMWGEILRICVVESNKLCGTHVHISPAPEQDWQLSHVQGLARAILKFQPAFGAILPAHRFRNRMAKNNLVDNSLLDGLTLDECFERIGKCNHYVDVGDLMTDGGDRYYAWNFRNMYYGGIGTVEFRSPPGMVMPKDSVEWADFVVAFVHSAVENGTAAKLGTFSADVKGLKDFTAKGMVGSAVPPEAIFEGKSGAIEPQKLGTITSEEAKVLKLTVERDNKKKRSKMFSKLAGRRK